jgi:hypothetical protein
MQGMQQQGTFEKKVRQQRGLCAVCKIKKAEHIDHDHVTNKVRGLLCFTCNTSLGKMNDSIPILMRAIKYLKMWKIKHATDGKRPPPFKLGRAVRGVYSYPRGAGPRRRETTLQ